MAKQTWYIFMSCPYTRIIHVVIDQRRLARSMLIIKAKTSTGTFVQGRNKCFDRITPKDIICCFESKTLQAERRTFREKTRDTAVIPSQMYTQLQRGIVRTEVISVVGKHDRSPQSRTDWLACLCRSTCFTQQSALHSPSDHCLHDS